MTSDQHRPRILLAKIGLDGHDRSVKVLARSFRDAGLEVIYTSLWQTCKATMRAAQQENVVGVSLLSSKRRHRRQSSMISAVIGS